MALNFSEWTPQELMALQKAKNERLNGLKNPQSPKSSDKTKPEPLIEHVTAATSTPGPASSDEPATTSGPPAICTRPPSGQHSTPRSHSSAHRSFTRHLSSARKMSTAQKASTAPKPTETVVASTASTLKDTDFINKTDKIIEYSSTDDA